MSAKEELLFSLFPSMVGVEGWGDLFSPADKGLDAFLELAA
jgi:hypothetical protein